MRVHCTQIDFRICCKKLMTASSSPLLIFLNLLVEIESVHVIPTVLSRNWCHEIDRIKTKA